MNPDKEPSKKFQDAYDATMKRIDSEPPVPTGPPRSRRLFALGESKIELPEEFGELRKAFEATYVPIKLATRSPKTAYLHRLELRRFDEFLGRPASLADLKDETVGAALAWLKEKKKLSISSVEKFRDCMTSLSRLLFRKRMVETDLELPPIRVPKQMPVAFTREQLHRLWEYLELLPGEIAGVPATLWFRALVSCFWDSGARQGEIFQLPWTDVDLQRGFIKCRADTVKMNKQDRLYRLSPETTALLRQIVLPERKIVFAFPYNNTTLYNTWRQILERAGLPTGRKYMFHILRKSVASHLQAAGVNAQFAMGHSDPRQTSEVYLDPRIAKPPAACDTLFRLSDYRAKEGEDEPRTDVG